MKELGYPRRMLQEEIRERRELARSGKCKCVGSGKVRVRTPSDAMRQRELERLNGRVRIYQLGRPMSRRQFRALPEDLQRLYVRLLRDKHGATRRAVRELIGEDFGLRFGEGDSARWNAFLARGRQR